MLEIYEKYVKNGDCEHVTNIENIPKYLEIHVRIEVTTRIDVTHENTRDIRGLRIMRIQEKRIDVTRENTYDHEIDMITR